MTDIEGNKILGIRATFKMLMNDECSFIFFFKRVIAGFLWRLQKRSEKKFEELMFENFDKAVRKRFHKAGLDCFLKSAAYAYVKVGELNSCDFKLTVEYYFCYLTQLYKLFVTSWFKHLLTKLFQMV